MSVAHIEQLLEIIPDHYILHFEDRDENVFVIEKVSLDREWQSVDFQLRKVTLEEQEAIVHDLGLDPSILD